jgi:CheY-like chemotaxis protein
LHPLSGAAQGLCVPARGSPSDFAPQSDDSPRLSIGRRTGDLARQLLSIPPLVDKVTQVLRKALLRPPPLAAAALTGGPQRKGRLTMKTTQERVGVVLLADDEDSVRTVASIFLERAGYAVLAASDGAEALRLATHCPLPIDLLVSDVSMPGMDGPELARRIAELHEEVKVLFTSGYSGEDLTASGVMEMGAHFLEKPYTMDLLVRAARETLDGGLNVGGNIPACVA